MSTNTPDLETSDSELTPSLEATPATASGDAPVLHPPSAPADHRPVDALRPGDMVVLGDRRGRRQLADLQPGARIHLDTGFVDCDAVLGGSAGVRVKTSKGELLTLFRPTLEEYVVLMPRAAQIVTPKDMAMIVQWADIFPGAVVVEAGFGSAGLSLGLLRAVGEAGRVVAFDIRPEFAACGRKNVLRWSADLASRLEVRLEDVHNALAGLQNVDRVVLDLADPWQALPGAAVALKPGGILVAYVPTIRQVDQLVLAVLDHMRFSDPEVVETIVRPWVADRVRLRPAQRIVGHTGFLVRTRRQGMASVRRS